MFDWIGSLRLREHTPMRVVLALSPMTRYIGVFLITSGLYLSIAAWSISPWLALVPALAMTLGAILATMRRELVFDREAGVLRVVQRTLFLENSSKVPLFHLRAVVIVVRPAAGPPLLRFQSRYLAYVERRVGEAIYLDESRRCAKLLEIAEAISEVAEVRLEYDATSQAVD